MLESPDVDALVIAAPDHWHAPAAIMAMQAGKHVYVEKPCSHNPAEGELLVDDPEAHRQGRADGQPAALVAERAEGHRRSCTVGASGASTTHAPGTPTRGRRSAPASRQPVPEWLDYDLWQGPAPRRPFVDNLVHYKWHWCWHWGTGESANNGTHMFDLARWGLQVEHPTRVTSAGGRYHFSDDWEFPDTQVVTLEYPDRKMVSWESMSANGYKPQGNGVGVTFHGEQGSLMIDGDGYTIYDLKGTVVEDVKTDPGAVTSQVGPVGAAGRTAHGQLPRRDPRQGDAVHADRRRSRQHDDGAPRQHRVEDRTRPDLRPGHRPDRRR